MPDASTYIKHFGGLNKVCKLLDITPNVMLNLSLDKCIILAQQFYNRYGKVPTNIDFDNTLDYPHSCYIRDVLGITWNQFLILADLPIFTQGENWIKNRKAELIVKQKLIEQGYNFKYLSEENINANYSFIINNNITVDVRYSAPVKSRYRHLIYYDWKFRVHIKDKKYIPDYFIGIGFNNYNQYDKMFIFPSKEITVKEVISIRINNIKNSKYAKYQTETIEFN